MTTVVDRSRDLRELLRPPTTALIVVDVQNDYFDPKGALGRAGRDVSSAAGIVPVVSRLVAAARTAGCFIVHTRNWHTEFTDSPTWVRRGRRMRSDSSLEPGRANTWGSEFFGLRPREDEFVLNKVRYDAFLGTSLDAVLRARRVESVVCIGGATNVCLDSTARAAVMRDYDTVIVPDACTSTDPDLHAAALENFARYFGSLAGSEEVLAAWMTPAIETPSPRSRDRQT